MDSEQVTPQPIQPTSPVTPTPVIVHKSNNVPLVGAIFFLALVIGAAAIYFGMQKKSETVRQVPPTEITPKPTATSELPITATPTTVVKLVSYSSTKLKDNSLLAYSISYPENWTKDTKRDAITDTFTLTNNGDTITIYQAPVGGAGCIFEGKVPVGPANDYTKTKFVEVLANNITFRRVQEESKIPAETIYGFCSNNLSSQTTFGTPTLFGAISYKITSKNTAALSEMDKIVATLKASQ